MMAFVDYASRDRGAVLHAGRDVSGRGLFAARPYMKGDSFYEGTIEFQKAAEQHGLRIIVSEMQHRNSALFRRGLRCGWCKAGTEQLPPSIALL
jgi:hypothetical protein